MARNTINTNANWLVVGAAPGAELFFDAARTWASRNRASEIATNAAWQLYATAEPTQREFDDCCAASVPDYFWLSDSTACELFGRAARWMVRNGTRIVSMERPPVGLQIRGLEALKPILIPLPDRDNSAPVYVPGVWAHPRLSGLICLEIAANHRATRLGGTIVLVGMTGYKSNDKHIVRDTFDGRMGKAAGAQHTRDWIGPYTQSVIDAHKDITFIVAGTPRYPLRGFNVVIAPTPEDFAQFLDRPTRQGDMA